MAVVSTPEEHLWGFFMPELQTGSMWVFPSSCFGHPFALAAPFPALASPSPLLLAAAVLNVANRCQFITPPHALLLLLL